MAVRQQQQQQDYDYQIQKEKLKLLKRAFQNNGPYDYHPRYIYFYNQALIYWTTRCMKWLLGFNDSGHELDEGVFTIIGYYNVRIQMFIWKSYRTHIFGDDSNDDDHLEIGGRVTTQSVANWWQTLAITMGIGLTRWDVLYPVFGLDAARGDALLGSQVTGAIVRTYILVQIIESIDQRHGLGQRSLPDEINADIRKSYDLAIIYLVSAIEEANIASTPDVLMTKTLNMKNRYNID